MDDLDLPKDRANLFEALDADSSGTLHLAELAQGLLKVRGELKSLVPVWSSAISFSRTSLGQRHLQLQLEAVLVLSAL